MKILEDYIRLTQTELFNLMRKFYSGKVTSKKGSYILVHGEAPVMLLAHMDTVHKMKVKQICKTENGNVLMSPQGIGGDDRCGVYALNKVYRLSTVKPWLLFLCDEEVGCVGAREFCRRYQKGDLPEGLKDIKCLIEIDRKGKEDAVYYDCCNSEFEEYITSKGFKTDFGSCSDISFIAPAMGVAAVNLSSGYYNQHTQHEYIIRSQLDATVRKVIEIVKDSVKEDFPRYEYIERPVYGLFGDEGCDDLYVGWHRGYRDREYDEWVLSNRIPEKIRQQYCELLDLYSSEELDLLRCEYGDDVIDLLYRSEFTIDEDANETLSALFLGTTGGTTK